MKLNCFHLCIVKLITKKKDISPTALAELQKKKKEDIPPTVLTEPLCIHAHTPVKSLKTNPL